MGHNNPNLSTHNRTRSTVATTQPSRMEHPEHHAQHQAHPLRQTYHGVPLEMEEEHLPYGGGHYYSEPKSAHEEVPPISDVLLSEESMDLESMGTAVVEMRGCSLGPINDDGNSHDMSTLAPPPLVH